MAHKSQAKKSRAKEEAKTQITSQSHGAEVAPQNASKCSYPKLDYVNASLMTVHPGDFVPAECAWGGCRTKRHDDIATDLNEVRQDEVRWCEV